MAPGIIIFEGNRVARRARAVRGLAGVSTASLRAELERRQSGVAAMQRRHQMLMQEADQIAAEIAAMGGAARNGAARGRGRPAPGRKRPKNEASLVDALVKLLQGKQLSVTDAARDVQKAGYRTSSASFRTIVNQALIKSPKFRKVARGTYTAR